jgi:hypothetical protein
MFFELLVVINLFEPKKIVILRLKTNNLQQE